MRDRKKNALDVIIEGYRQCVGLMFIMPNGKTIVGRSIFTNHLGRLVSSYKLPQGGIQKGESLDEAVKREAFEELGLLPHDYVIKGRVKTPYTYDLPRESDIKGQSLHWHIMFVNEGVELDIRKSKDWMDLPREEREFTDLIPMDFNLMLSMVDYSRVDSYRHVLNTPETDFIYYDENQPQRIDTATAIMEAA